MNNDFRFYFNFIIRFFPTLLTLQGIPLILAHYIQPVYTFMNSYGMVVLVVNVILAGVYARSKTNEKLQVSVPGAAETFWKTFLTNIGIMAVFAGGFYYSFPALRDILLQQYGGLVFLTLVGLVLGAAATSWIKASRSR